MSAATAIERKEMRERREEQPAFCIWQGRHGIHTRLSVHLRLWIFSLSVRPQQCRVQLVQS
jgi:hypothetical protein